MKNKDKIMERGREDPALLDAIYTRDQLDIGLSQMIAMIEHGDRVAAREVEDQSREPERWDIQ